MARAENSYKIGDVTYIVAPLQNQEVVKMKPGKVRDAFIKQVAYKTATPEKPVEESEPNVGAATQGTTSSDKLGG